MSVAESTLREITPIVIQRIKAGAAPLSALTMSGIKRPLARQYLNTGLTGSSTDILDEGLIDACKTLYEQVSVARASVEAKLDAAWAQAAANDWRAAAEYRRRHKEIDIDYTDKQEVVQEVSVEHRSEDAVLEALKQLTSGND